MMRFLSLLAFLFPALAAAQTTGGVFGPTVSLDDRQVQYRIAIADAPAGDALWNHRIHYQEPLSEDLRVRGVVGTRETPDSEVDFDFVQAELAWQYTPDGQPYQAGLRFDATVRGDDRPDGIALNWVNQWVWGEDPRRKDWRARLLLLNFLQVADRTSDELAFQTRFEVSRAVGNVSGRPLRVGGEGFVNLGDTGGLDVLNRRSGALVGPYATIGLGNEVSVFLGTLHGISGGATDDQVRLWLTKGF